jgi:asparagine synthase (glutamine-hydrolysing)
VEKEWWDIHRWYEKKHPDDFDTALEKVDSFLHKGIQRRVESSDLEVGSFLSGGIDSGLVTAIAKQYNQQLKTFTVSFKGEYDEAPLAKLVADRYQTNHTEINISFDQLQSDVETILCNYGEPFFDSSAIPSYYVSKAAKEHLTVILNGDGADELFGGYRRYVPFANYDFFKSGGLVKNAANVLNKVLPKSHNKKSLYNYLYRLASLASKDSVEIYLSAGVDIFEDYEHLIQAPEGLDCIAVMRKDFDALANSSLSGLKKIMNMDFDATLFTDLLVKMDIATMAHSLEGRSPCLCNEILEYAPGLDDKY